MAASVPVFAEEKRGDTLVVTPLENLREFEFDRLEAAAVGVFQERVWLWASDPVDLSVKNQLRRWFPKTLPKVVAVRSDREMVEASASRWRTTRILQRVRS